MRQSPTRWIPWCVPRCGFPMRVLSFIEDSPVVRKILDHLGLWNAQQRPPRANATATDSIGGVLPWVAEDPYPYDQTGWAADEPAWALRLDAGAGTDRRRCLPIER